MSDPTVLHRPENYDVDTGIAFTFDHLCDRGFSPEELTAALDNYSGDLWMGFFGPLLDRLEEVLFP